MNLYQQQILEHYRNPKHYGELANFTYRSKLQNLSCGDSIEVFLKVKGNIIEAASYTGEGCAIALASADMHIGFILKQETSKILSLNWQSVVNLLRVELSPSRIKCAHLALETIQHALRKNTELDHAT